MAGYQYSQSFQGGLQALPAGYMEAATMPGRAIAAGIESFGNSMAAAINKYAAHREEGQFYDQKIADMAGLLQNIPIGAPAGTPEGDTVKHIMGISGAKDPEGLQDWIAKAPSMSLGKKKALAADLSFAIARYDDAKRNELGQQLQRAQLQQYMQQQVDQRALADAYGYMNKPENITKTVPGGEFTDQIPPGIDPKTVQPGQKFFVPGEPVQEPKNYGELYRDLNQKMLQAGASPAAIAQAEKVLEGAGFAKPIKVEEAKTSDGFTVVRADGKIDILPPPKPIEGKVPNEYQAKSITFAKSLDQNEKTIKEVMDKGYKPEGKTVLSWTPEAFRTSERKVYEAAKNSWIENFLRHRSGAAISNHEYEAIDKQYFPQMGDDKTVMQAKEQMRLRASDAIKEPLKKTFGNDYFGESEQAPASGGVKKFNRMTGKIE